MVVFPALSLFQKARRDQKILYILRKNKPFQLILALMGVIRLLTVTGRLSRPVRQRSFPSGGGLHFGLPLSCQNPHARLAPLDELPAPRPCGQVDLTFDVVGLAIGKLVDHLGAPLVTSATFIRSPASVRDDIAIVQI